MCYWGKKTYDDDCVVAKIDPHESLKYSIISIIALSINENDEILKYELAR